MNVESTGSGRTYAEANIQVLSGREAIRKRPGMYLGSVDSRGLHQMLWDLVVHILEGPVGHLELTFHRDGGATLRDDGAAFPASIGDDPAGLARAVTLIGHPFIPLPILAALSDRCEVQVRGPGLGWRQRFDRGEVLGVAERLGPSGDVGTTYRFRPDPTIFTGRDFDAEAIAERLGELAALNPEARVKLLDERTGLARSWHHRGGLADLVRERSQGSAALHEPIAIGGRCGPIEFRTAFRYRAEAGADISAFANLWPVDPDRWVADGGGLNLCRRSAHVAGFLQGLRRAIDPGSFLRQYGPREAGRFPVAHLLDGLVAAVSVRLDDPTYLGCTHHQLGNPEARHVAFSLTYLRLAAHFAEHPEAREAIQARVCPRPT